MGQTLHHSFTQLFSIFFLKSRNFWISDNDPRLYYLEEHTINELTTRAFPLGYTSSIKFQNEPPSNELLHMMYLVGSEKIFTQYMTSFESFCDFGDDVAVYVDVQMVFGQVDVIFQMRR